MQFSSIKQHFSTNAVTYKVFVTAIVFFISAICLILVIASFTQKESKQDVKSITTQPTVDEALAALRRVSPNALQICYDSGVGGYLFQFEEQGTLKWWFINYRQMWKSQNGTWLTNIITDNEWVQVGADVTGLICDIKQ